MVRQIRALCSRAIVPRLAINISLPRSDSRRDTFSVIEVENVDAVPDFCRRVFLVEKQRENGRLESETESHVEDVYTSRTTIRSRYSRRHLRNGSESYEASNLRASRRSLCRPANRVVPDALRFPCEIFSNNCIVSFRNCRNT